MSRRRRSRFTSWAVGSDADSERESDAELDVEGDAAAATDLDTPLYIGGDIGSGSESEDGGLVVAEHSVNDGPSTGGHGLVPSLSDLLVGGSSLSEHAAGKPNSEGTVPGGVVPGPSSGPATELPYEGRIVMVPVESVTPNAVQPRRRFEESSLAALTASVAELGVLQPIIVRPVGDVVIDLDDPDAGGVEVNRYELVAGERRWRAARRAGLEHIPALIREVDDLRSLEEAIVENLHRVDLNPLEEAGAFQQLVDDFGLTQEDVAARVGKSRSAVANTLRLLQLPGSIQRMVMDGELSAGHARTLLAEPNLARQRQLAARILEENLSVRQAEELARELAGRQGKAGKSGDGGGRSSRAKSAGALEVENHLADLLDTRVRVAEGAKRGSITIEFADAEDLDRIYRLFVGPRRRKQTD